LLQGIPPTQLLAAGQPDGDQTPSGFLVNVANDKTNAAGNVFVYNQMIHRLFPRFGAVIVIGKFNVCYH